MRAGIGSQTVKDLKRPSRPNDYAGIVSIVDPAGIFSEGGEDLATKLPVPLLHY